MAARSDPLQHYLLIRRLVISKVHGRFGKWTGTAQLDKDLALKAAQAAA